jgi:hypothetical protein
MPLTKHARGSVPNLKQDKEDERYEKGDKGSGVDRDDVLAVLYVESLTKHGRTGDETIC